MGKRGHPPLQKGSHGRHGLGLCDAHPGPRWGTLHRTLLSPPSCPAEGARARAPGGQGAGRYTHTHGSLRKPLSAGLCLECGDSVELGTLRSHADAPARAGDTLGSRPGPFPGPLSVRRKPGEESPASGAPGVGREPIIIHVQGTAVTVNLLLRDLLQPPQAEPLRLPGPEVWADTGTSSGADLVRGTREPGVRLPPLARVLHLTARPEGALVSRRPPGRGTGLAC